MDKIIYVGDSSNVINRIIYNHCNGNVEASAFRKTIAELKGFKIVQEKRQSGSIRKRVSSEEEKQISDYIHSGKWRYIICSSYNEAHDFQWFVIEKLDPPLNKNRKPWNKNFAERYEKLFKDLLNSPLYKYDELKEQLRQINNTGPGVYIFYHQFLPNEI